MKRFQVNVNGKQYVVEVDELGENQAPVQPQAAKAAPVAAPQPQAAEPAPVAPVASGVAEGFEVKAPLRGQILKVAVAPGTQVKKGQLLLTIEALKLENEIASPVSGVVSGVFTQAGVTVETGAVLITIKES